MESILNVMHVTKKEDHMMSDFMSGFYTLGIASEHRAFLAVNIHRELYKLTGLPIGWSISPYYFCDFTGSFMRHHRG
jgi:hypothetical protein